MTPGPKPKGVPRRQTLGVAVQPSTIQMLDKLLETFNDFSPYLPDWFSLPDTRSSAASWILERCIVSENKKLNYIFIEYLRRYNELPYELSEDDRIKHEKYANEIDSLIGNDPFLLSLRSILEENYRIISANNTKKMIKKFKSFEEYRAWRRGVDVLINENKLIYQKLDKKFTIEDRKNIYDQYLNNDELRQVAINAGNWPNDNNGSGNLVDNKLA